MGIVTYRPGLHTSTKLRHVIKFQFSGAFPLFKLPKVWHGYHTSSGVVTNNNVNEVRAKWLVCSGSLRPICLLLTMTTVSCLSQSA